MISQNPRIREMQCSAVGVCQLSRFKVRLDSVHEVMSILEIKVSAVDV